MNIGLISLKYKFFYIQFDPCASITINGVLAYIILFLNKHTHQRIEINCARGFVISLCLLIFTAMDLKYRYTRGFSDRKHDLLYLEDEKYLFVRRTQSEDGQKIYYGCYDALDGPNGCKARCTLDTKSGKCTRNDKPHNGHDNHEVTYRDMVSLNAMKDHCKYLSENFPFSAHKIPIDEIFLTEMAK